MTRKDKNKLSLKAALYSKELDGVDYWIEYPDDSIDQLMESVKVNLTKQDIVDIIAQFLKGK